MRIKLQLTKKEITTKNHPFLDSVISLSDLWDYYSKSIQSDLGFGGKYEIWYKVEKAIEIINGLRETERLKDMIKIMGILEICAPLLEISLTTDVIHFAITSNQDDIESTGLLLQRLKEAGLIKFLRVRQVWEIYLGTGIDWETEIQRILARKKFPEVRSINILNRHLRLDPFIPRRLNHKQKMTRYFYPIIKQPSKDKLEIFDWSLEFDKHQNPDGLIVYFPNASNSQIQELSTLTLSNSIFASRIIFIIPKREITLKLVLEGIFALENLKKDTEFMIQDPKIAYELEFELQEQIGLLNFLARDFVNNLNNVIIVFGGVCTQISSVKELDILSSSTLEKLYSGAPIINNELFNKNKVSPVIKRELEILLSKLLNPTSTFDEMMQKNPAHVVFYRTLTYKSNLDFYFDEESGKTLMKLPASNDHDKNNYLPALNRITEYLDSEDSTDLINLIDILRAPPYGLRLPIVALFISMAVLQYESKEFLLSKSKDFANFDLLSTSSLFKAIIEGESLVLHHREDTPEKRTRNYKIIELIHTNSKLIIDHSLNIDFSGSQLSNLNFIRFVQLWFLLIPPFARRTDKFVSTETVKIRPMFEEIAIRNQSSHSQFLEAGQQNFDKVLKILKLTVLDLEDAKENLDVFIINKYLHVKGIQKKVKLKNSWRLVVGLLYHSLTGQRIDSGSNEFKILKDPRLHTFAISLLSEVQSISDLAKLISKQFVSTDPRDWTDGTVQEFTRILNLQISIMGEKVIGGEDETIEISFNHENVSNKITFYPEELSPVGDIILKTLVTNFNMSGRSLSENEKLNILNKLIKSLVISGDD
ncbi:MAG: hypothetical protein IH840_08310 [Candidatus Heimdallarchaeota archaeon]|nr:hypothetical protein [Candidatus Heimdallarchaeota archaeon]